MIFIVNTENRSLFESDLLEMHRQRKAVFVDKAGWRIPVRGDMEIDRYDRPETTYLIAKRTPEAGEVLASVRLLPTVLPHLMSDLFREACSGVVPSGPSVWEVSRFCVSQRICERSARLALLWEIITAVLETGLLFGIEQVTFVANRALLPLALGCGWNATPLGPTLRDGNDEITAVAAAITPHALREVRSRFGIIGPVTRFPIPLSQVAA
ncbi:MAG TPA: acyl-homoserine-lactone synthase [Steroidobacteraceae bacterium]|jgi:acyl-homoserine lactone synthase